MGYIRETELKKGCGRHQLYSEGKRHTFSEAVERYFKEQTVSVVKKGHLLWWKKELGSLFLHDVRPAILSEKKQKLLTEPTPKGVVRSKSTCNRYLATLSHLMGICVKQWEWASENPVRRITREKEPRERTRFLNSEELSRFLEACRISDNPYLFTFVVLLLSTESHRAKLIEKLCEQSPIPVNIMVLSEISSSKKFAELGVARISYGPYPYCHAMEAIKEAGIKAFSTV